MYFIADHLNHTKLLEYFSGWTRKAYAKDKNSEYYQKMDQFLFKFYSLTKVHRRIIEIYDNIIAEFEKNKESFALNSNKIIFKHPKMVDLLNQYDIYFKTLKELQDISFFIVKSEDEIKIKVASEMERAIPKLDAYGFDEEAIQLFEDYWNDIGKYVIKFQHISDYTTQILKESYLIIKPNTEIIFEPPSQLIGDFPHISNNILHFVVLSYNRFRQFIEDFSLYFGFERPMKFERFFPRKFDINVEDLDEGQLRTLAIYFYGYGESSGMEVYYNKDMNIKFQPFK